MSRKMGFWSVFALVTGSQIGTGVFMLPSSLAPYGMSSLYGWVLSSLGAIALALVFGALCAQFPKTGGPHVYVENAFGKQAAFFTGWTYWIISWVSTTAVIASSIGYLSPLIGNYSPTGYLTLECILLFSVTFINLKGLKTAGNAEFLLTSLKFIPLIIMPFAAIFMFDINNFRIDESVAELSTAQVLSQVTLFTLWGFIGLESATAPAGSVENPEKTIPRAIVLGTSCVAILYIFNSISVMGLIPGNVLMYSEAPYVDVAQIVFGGNWHLMISVVASIVCVGTLNAWVLTSGQIALGLSEDGFFPEFLCKKNKNEAPFGSLLISCAGIIPLLILTSSQSIAGQITSIIDFSVVSFLFVYLISCFSLFRLSMIKKQKLNPFLCFFAGIATIFCVWVIYQTPLKILAIASLFTLSGIPLYFLWYRPKQKIITKVMADAI
jgi:APA family basic amino acid/polyamine antiporter